MGNSWSSFDELSEPLPDAARKGSDPDKKKKTRRAKTLRNRNTEYSNKVSISDQVRDIREYKDIDAPVYNNRSPEIEPIEAYMPSIEYNSNHPETPVKKHTGSRAPKHSKRRKTVKFREDLDETDV